MKALHTLLVAYVVIIFSCKKESEHPGIPDGDPNNELTAVVSYLGGKDSIHHANGNKTSFNKTVHPSGDSLIIIRGTIGEYGTYSSRTIEITLANISVVGTYPFRRNAGSKQYAECVYQVGDVFFSQVFRRYNTSGTLQSGSITVEALTADLVQASFCANCYDSDPINFVAIKNGTFKGKF